jgi:hypothetical protein
MYLWGIMTINDHNHWHSQSASCVVGKNNFRIKYLRHICQLARRQNRRTTLNKHSSEESVLLNVTRSMRRVIIRNFVLLHVLKLRRRWEDNTKMVLKEMGWGGTERIALA